MKSLLASSKLQSSNTSNLKQMSAFPQPPISSNCTITRLLLSTQYATSHRAANSTFNLTISSPPLQSSTCKSFTNTSKLQLHSVLVVQTFWKTRIIPITDQLPHLSRFFITNNFISIFQLLQPTTLPFLHSTIQPLYWLPKLYLLFFVLRKPLLLRFTGQRLVFYYSYDNHHFMLDKKFVSLALQIAVNYWTAFLCIKLGPEIIKGKATMTPR